MKISGALTALALLTVSAQAASISFGQASGDGSSQRMTLTKPNSKGSGSGDDNNNAFSSWSPLPGRTGSGSDGAYLADSISTSYGLDVSFQYSQGEGEDGFSFLVLDASRSDKSGRQESILGIEFNRIAIPFQGNQGDGKQGKGNNDDEGNGNNRASTQDVISLRGPGDGTGNLFTSFNLPNYVLIATTADGGTNSMKVDDGWSKIQPKHNEEKQDTEVTVDTSQLGDRKLPVTVWMKGEDGDRVVVARYDAYQEVEDYYGGAANIPQTMRIGFSGSTGGGSASLSSSTLTLADPGGVPEPSTLMLSVGGFMIAGASAWKRRRSNSRSTKP